MRGGARGGFEAPEDRRAGTPRSEGSVLPGVIWRNGLSRISRVADAAIAFRKPLREPRGTACVVKLEGHDLELWEAAKDGNFDKVKKALEKANVDCMQASSQAPLYKGRQYVTTPLHVAAMLRRPKISEGSEEEEETEEEKKRTQDTPAAIMRLLLEARADPVKEAYTESDPIRQRWLQAIHLAAGIGCCECHTAAQQSEDCVIRLLAKYDVDVNAEAKIETVEGKPDLDIATPVIYFYIIFVSK